MTVATRSLLASRPLGPRHRRWVGAGAVLIAWCWSAALPPSARACATCTVGDPTLTTMGTTQPFAGRLRASLNLQHRTDAVGEPGLDRVRLQEQRLELGLAYALSERVMLSVLAPMVRRQLEYVNLARQSLLSVGDVEVRSRFFVFRDRTLAPRHLVSLDLGMELPTAPIDRDAMGRPTPPELQAGTGSFDPLVGVAYAWFSDAWSAYTSQVLLVRTRGRADFRAGTSLRSTNMLQYQWTKVLALRGGVAFRWEGRTHVSDGIEPDTGGFIGFVTPEVVISPAMDWVVRLYVHVPVVNALIGHHDEGPLVGLGVAYDL